ncbi:MAG TPA: hypothetical protein VFY06_07695 [Verrucomicrobiae bacterium]|nr:hypothetical protein [Verrucomicrobiae bacterium]
MTHRPRHNRHRPYSERNQIMVLVVLAVVLVLALMGLLLWWSNKP